MTTFEKILLTITISCCSALILLNVYEATKETSVKTIVDTNNKTAVTTKATDNKTTKININTATKSELMTLDGIGEVYADRIIEYRTDNKFDNITELMNIKGIGPSTFSKIKDKITV